MEAQNNERKGILLAREVAGIKKVDAEAKAVKTPRKEVVRAAISTEAQRAIDNIKALGIESIRDVLWELGERGMLSSASKRPSVVLLAHYGFSRKEIMEALRVSAAYYAKCVSGRL